MRNLKTLALAMTLALALPLAFSPPASAFHCTHGAVAGLDPQRDNFLSVRRAPGSALWVAAEIDQLYTGDVVCLYERVGNWFHVSYQRNGDGRAIAQGLASEGKSEGWVWYSYIAIVQTPAPSYAPPSYAPPVYVPPAPAPSLPCYLQLIDGGNALYANVSLGSVQINMLVDTGATDMSVSESLADQLLRSGNAAPGESVTVTIADGSQSVRRSIIIFNVTVAGRVVRNVTAGVAPDGSMLLLGMSVLSRASARVSLDLASKRLVFE
jgi:clan AA aspartic protease (TIGR02281 family)